jgi:hypothetical protein
MTFVVFVGNVECDGLGQGGEFHFQDFFGLFENQIAACARRHSSQA